MDSDINSVMIVALSISFVLAIGVIVFTVYAHEQSYVTKHIPDTDIELRVRDIKSRLAKMYALHDTMSKTASVKSINNTHNSIS